MDETDQWHRACVATQPLKRAGINLISHARQLRVNRIAIQSCWQRLLSAISIAILIQFSGTARAESTDLMTAGLPTDLSELSLDQLMNIEVTSVSKRSEKLSDAAAAIYVLSGDDIHRSGAHNIAEALRLVPGLEVARINSRSYAISARGFNSGSADKLQVLVDGRSVYTPLTSAVFWDVLDTYLDDIDRIEVIRGPGATLWGANAVNGVINIVTRSSKETLGTVLSGGVGTEDRARAEIRSGTTIGNNASLRVYAKARQQTSSVYADGSDALDASRTYQAGIRSDWTPQPSQALTVSSDIYTARFDTPPTTTPPNTEPTDASGGNLLARWTSGIDTASRWSVQGYFDQYRRNIPTIYSENRQTFDLDFQHQLQLNAVNTLVYGVSYRSSHDNTGEAPAVAIVFVPPSRTLQTESAFVQDQQSFADGRVVVTVGSKFEHNDFSKLEFQPSVRVGWHMAERASTWASVSRAVRTPNRVNSDIAIYCPPPNGYPGACGPGLFSIGNPSVTSEKLIAYEWGLRLWTERQLSFDLATFYNDYSDVISGEAPTAGAPFGSIANKIRAHSFGGEVVLDWKPRSDLSAQLSYSYLQVNATPTDGSTDTTSTARLEGSDPRHQVGLRISLRPADRWLLNSFLRYVDGLSAYGVPAYTELNLRAAYQLSPSVELSLTGENLLSPHHPEFGATIGRSEISRSALLGFTWHWQ